MRNSPKTAGHRFNHPGAYPYGRSCNQLQGQATEVPIQARHGVEVGLGGLRECQSDSPERWKRLSYAGKRISESVNSRKLSAALSSGGAA